MTRIALGHAAMLALAGLLRTAAILYLALWAGVAAAGGHPRTWIALLVPVAPLVLTVVTVRLAASTGHVLRVVPFAACAVAGTVALVVGATALGAGPPALVVASALAATTAVAALARRIGPAEVTPAGERVRTAGEEVVPWS